jgi:hypothetical protein
MTSGRPRILRDVIPAQRNGRFFVSNYRRCLIGTEEQRNGDNRILESAGTTTKLLRWL